MALGVVVTKIFKMRDITDCYMLMESFTGEGKIDDVAEMRFKDSFIFL